MKPAAFSSLRRFAHDKKGAISIMFGASLVMFVLLVGGVIDFGLALLSRSNLQSAGDAGALASAIVPSGVNPDQVAERYFNANYRSNPVVAVTFKDTEYQIDSQQSSIRSTSQMKTNFLVGGNSEKTISVGATSVVATATANPDFDMLLVVDGSGSMNEDASGVLYRYPSKMLGLKQAATDLTNIVMTPEFANIRLGFVEWDNRTKPGRVFELSSSKQRIQTVIQGASGQGRTCGECGLYDANRLLTTVAPITARLDGQTYSPSRRIVFLTDGIQNFTRDGQSWPDNHPVPINAVVAQCNVMKNSGINITTIGFGAEVANNAVTKNGMTQCASTGTDGKPQFYIAPDNATLVSIFKKIALSAKSLRLTK